MTARVNQAPVLVLAGVDSTSRLDQVATLILWGTGSTPILDQLAALVLTSPPRRRVIGITD